MRSLKVWLICLLALPAYGIQELNHWAQSRVLELTHLTDKRADYVSLPEATLQAITTLKIQLEAEARVLGNQSVDFFPDNPNNPFWQDAYSLWMQTPQSPYKYSMESRSENLLCRPGAVCTPDDYFFRHSIQAFEARDLFQSYAFQNIPSHAPLARTTPSTGRGPASEREQVWLGGGRNYANQNTHGHPQPLPPAPAGHRWDTTSGHWILCPLEGAESCVSYGAIDDYYLPKNGQHGADPFGGEGGYAGTDNPPSEYLDEDRSFYRPPGSSQRGTGDAPSARATPPTPSPSRAAPPTSSSHMAQAFQRCENSYRRALKVCGSSLQQVDSQAVQGELNLAAGMQLATYLQAARATTQMQGKSMYEICDATEKMARSMTALNAAYTAICTGAQNSCASSCEQAESYMRRVDTSNEEFSAALASTSRNFDPGRFYSACRSDMNSQMTQGIFQTAQTAQMMARANSCKKQIAAGGPCATQDMWNSQACYDHCQEPQNSYHPACARFAAMNSSCSNPQFAARNPHCLCINHPTDPSCTGGGNRDEFADGGGGGRDGHHLPPGMGRGSSEFSSVAAGSFGQDYAGGGATGKSAASSQGSFPAGGAGGPIMNSDGGSGGGGPQAPAARGAQASGYKTNIMDGVQSFGGGRRQAAPGRRVVYGDMNSQNPFRRIAVETDDPNFDLSQYLPPEDYEPGSVPKCYYGKDRIGCMHGPSLFEMVSRQYRRIKHEMMP